MLRFSIQVQVIICAYLLRFALYCVINIDFWQQIKHTEFRLAESDTKVPNMNQLWEKIIYQSRNNMINVYYVE